MQVSQQGYGGVVESGSTGTTHGFSGSTDAPAGCATRHPNAKAFRSSRKVGLDNIILDGQGKDSARLVESEADRLIHPRIGPVDGLKDCGGVAA